MAEVVPSHVVAEHDRTDDGRPWLWVGVIIAMLAVILGFLHWVTHPGGIYDTPTTAPITTGSTTEPTGASARQSASEPPATAEQDGSASQEGASASGETR
jgi:hypothetical protein